MLPTLLASLLSAAPIVCPAGTTLKHESSDYSDWYMCERDGVREGPFAFVSDGHVASTSAYKNGLEDGERRSIHKDGRVSAIVRLKAGEKHGTEELFHANGKKWLEQQFVAGKEHGKLRRWREDGSLIVESEWKNGEPQSYVAYFPSGAQRFAASAPLPNTTVHEWNEQGELLRKVKVVNGHEPNDAPFDDGHLSCPKDQFEKVRALGVSYTQDECGGWPELNAKTNRMETFASVPRKSRKALLELGCGFQVTRPGEDLSRMIWQSYFHSKAWAGE